MRKAINLLIFSVGDASAIQKNGTNVKTHNWPKEGIQLQSWQINEMRIFIVSNIRANREQPRYKAVQFEKFGS